MLTIENNSAVEVVGNLRVEREELAGKFYVKVWRGKATKPYAYYSFKTEIAREAYVSEQVNADANATAFKAKRKADEAARLAQTRAAMVPGTVLVYSWGWEQTNVSFYQVVKTTGASVLLQEIGSTIEQTGLMAGRATPQVDNFTGAAFTKRIMSYGVKMDHGTARVTEPGKSHYVSWYA